MRRRLLGVAVLLLAAGALAGCKDASTVSQSTIEHDVAQQLMPTVGERASVHCQGGLKTVKGRAQHCTLTDRGTAYPFLVEVVDTQGHTRVVFDKPLPAFPPARLEASVAQDFENSHGTAPSAVHCVGGLSQTPGDRTTCDLTVADKQETATVTTGQLDKKTGITSFSTSYTP
jgi:hypothetical protein